MTLQGAYQEGIRRLEEAGIEEAKIDAWELLEYETGICRAMYFADSQREMEKEQEMAYFQKIQKRAGRIPLQHLTGIQEFMGLPFRVNEQVLIPRQDTEVLVEEVEKILTEGMEILDVCTGSGCILQSLLKRHPGLTGTGIDISKEALAVAQENAKCLEVAATFVESDLFTNVKGSYDVIVSNPPYIKTAVIETLEEEVRLHDPWIALDGKEDGLYFYRKIIEESPQYLKQGGSLYFEIGHDQGNDVKKLMEEAGYEHVMVKKDLAGLDRVVFGVYNISEGR